ncbi:unnamed protein product [Closterium sp. Naga37s-1]|nr:unnamed protein product [Closterium sp. Naga37s-1]
MEPRSRLPLAVLTLLALLSLLASSVAAADAATATASSSGVAGVDLSRVTATATATNSSVAGVDLSRVVLLSPWAPRAFLYKQFLSDAECDHIIARATPRLERSGVVNNDDGSSFVSEIRTSSGAFLNKGEDAVMRTVEQRISEWTFLPLQNQEALQVLRYTKGQKYEPHVDYFHDAVNTQRGGHRYATVLMYLNNVTLGGETVFPKVKDDSPKDETWSDCAKGFLAVKPQKGDALLFFNLHPDGMPDPASLHYACPPSDHFPPICLVPLTPPVKPEKGDALLFFNLHPDGTPDPASLHYACPVLHGVKWSAPKWIHVADFDKPLAAADAGTDDNGAAADGGDGSCTDSNA